MSRSISATANFIFKLHIAALRAQVAGMRIYPVMDGFYASASDKNRMLTFLRNVFRSVAEEFNTTAESHHLIAHLAWCKARAQAILYSEDRIEAHKKMVEQYFQD